MGLRKLNKLRVNAGVFALFLLLLQTEGISQNSPKNDFLISAESHYGFIISHRGSIVHLVRGHIGGGELTYTFRTSGIKPWQTLHRYPELGVSAIHLYLGNPAELGNLDAIYPFMDLRLNKPERKLKLSLRLGLGLGYISKPYDRITNHRNNAIGSHFNAYVNLRLNSFIMLNNSWRLESGIGLSHVSNGALKSPNLGLNMATVNVGVGYIFGNKNLEMKKDSAISKLYKKWSPSVIGVFGFKELATPLGDKYMSYALIGNLYRNVNNKNKFCAGIEFVYSNANKYQLEHDSVYTGKIKDVMKVGAKVGYAFVIDRLSIPLDFGFYVYQNEHLTENVFSRIGLRYMVSKHVFANLTLYTHWAKADYFEWGVGYEF